MHAAGSATTRCRRTTASCWVQPTLEGSLGRLVGFRLMPEFAGDSATILDAYLDLRFDPRATLRVGKFKAPVGIERLQSSAATTFVELGLSSELAPSRDLGVQLQGEFDGGALTYAAGVFNGAPDGRDGASANSDDAFEYAARVFWEPFRGADNAAAGLGVGLAASTGDVTGGGSAALPRYRTPGQAQFFGYRGSVQADGARRRIEGPRYVHRLRSLQSADDRRRAHARRCPRLQGRRQRR